MLLTALYLTSIAYNFCMMALEILGGRLLYPVFGSSVDVWAAIISVFILSLSLGYFLGGRIADRMRSNLGLGWILLGAGAFYLLVPTYALAFSNSLGEAIQTSRFGVLIAALVLFLPPSLLLGMLSPMLVKLVFTDASRIGTVIGTLSAVGSVGNVLGVLVANYVLLEHVSLNHNLLGMGAVLSVLGLLHLARRITVAAPAAPATPAAGAAA